jgi:hypothetical protein
MIAESAADFVEDTVPKTPTTARGDYLQYECDDDESRCCWWIGT